jgi:hypothetical protein
MPGVLSHLFKQGAPYATFAIRHLQAAYFRPTLEPNDHTNKKRKDGRRRKRVLRAKGSITKGIIRRQKRGKMAHQAGP